jgi:protoporphyrinogen oxidase
MPDFPLGTPFLAANFAPASLFCHLCLHKPAKNSIVKNFQTLGLYDMIRPVESKQKFVYPGEKYVRRPERAEIVEDSYRRSAASALADSDWGDK